MVGGGGRAEITAISLFPYFSAWKPTFPAPSPLPSPNAGERRAEHPFNPASPLFQTRPFAHVRPTRRQPTLGWDVLGFCRANRLEGALDHRWVPTGWRRGLLAPENGEGVTLMTLFVLVLGFSINCCPRFHGIWRMWKRGAPYRPPGIRPGRQCGHRQGDLGVV